MNLKEGFDDYFKSLTGHGPFPWQKKLFEEFIDGQFRSSCPIPTGLGKTSIIAVWLLSLAYQAHTGTTGEFPRRLVYVVNRRTVVDQATREAEKIRENLITHTDLTPIVNTLQSIQAQETEIPVAISTLRGQFADNAEWRADPARASVIIGTVDMIGSRLLFSGYGCGFRSRPLHAGFLGQASLLVHDEAHLEPAFQALVTSIEKEQQRCHEYGRFRVMELTATSRTSSESENPLFTDMDRKHSDVKKRVYAKKWIKMHPEDKNRIADKVSQLAKGYKDSNKAILIFLRELKDVQKVYDSLCKVVLDKHVARLTGTLRGWERDDLVRCNSVFARFAHDSVVTPQQGTVYLICTSAGEVGVNMSADHLVCDLTPLDSMIQRFGRVNRFGDGDAYIELVHPKLEKPAVATTDDTATAASGAETADAEILGDATTNSETKKKGKPETPYERACSQTRITLLEHLPKRAEDQRYDSSPAALAAIPIADRQAAFTPPPVILPTSDILFDAWSLTSVRQRLPGRPPVADWLHGVAVWEPPAAHVAWREEVDLIIGDLLDICTPEDLLEDYPLKPHELLRDRTDRVFEELEKIAHRCPEKTTWLIDSDGNVEVLSLEKLVNRHKKPVVNLADCTVLLPPAAGGLRNGTLDGDAAFDETGNTPYDIADQWLDGKRRSRGWDDHQIPDGMRLVRTIDTKVGSEAEFDEAETPSRRYWQWYVLPHTADDDGSRTARDKQELSSHLQSAEHFTERLIAKLKVSEPEASAVVLAARWHDIGKDRLIWQRSIGNRDYPQVKLAKSGKGMKPIDLTTYRHEFGSLIDLADLQEFAKLPPDVKDLVLHMIASHHGRARPYFPDQEAFDPDRPEGMANGIALTIPRRFARLQRKYGRWGLAYLESLVRASDIMASQAVIADAQPDEGGDQ